MKTRKVFLLVDCLIGNAFHRAGDTVSLPIDKGTRMVKAGDANWAEAKPNVPLMTQPEDHQPPADYNYGDLDDILDRYDRQQEIQCVRTNEETLNNLDKMVDDPEYDQQEVTTAKERVSETLQGIKRTRKKRRK